MVKCYIFFVVWTELLNNSRVPTVLLRGATVATLVTRYHGDLRNRGDMRESDDLGNLVT
jgi:hypothetical protein